MQADPKPSPTSAMQVMQCPGEHCAYSFFPDCLMKNPLLVTVTTSEHQSPEEEKKSPSRLSLASEQGSIKGCHWLQEDKDTPVELTMVEPVPRDTQLIPTD